MIDFINECSRETLKIYEAFLALPNHRITAMRWLNCLKKSELDWGPFSRRHLQVLDNLKGIISNEIVTTWKNLFEQCWGKIKTLKLENSIDETPAMFKLLSPEETLGMFREITLFFIKFLEIPDDQVMSWLLEHRLKETYTYPFYHSFGFHHEMPDKIDPNHPTILEWKQKYQLACQRLQKPHLQGFLDEIPPDIKDCLKTQI